MQSTYLSTPSQISRKSGFGAINKIAPAKAFISIALALFVGFAGFLSAYNESKSEKAEAFDAVKFVMCMWGDDSVPQQMYQLTQTSDLQFQLLSKSAITFGVDDVDSGINWLLEVSGSKFNENNEKIIGQSMGPTTPDKAAQDKLKFNGGKTINPYDRFGVAGLKFSAYQGEWKHVVIDACSDDSKATDPKAGVYYDDRLEPRSTWEDIDNTQDVRTKQFSKGFASQYLTSLVNMIANWIFSIVKFMVAITIALINFAFSDVTDILGLNDVIYGSDDPGGNTGIVKDLHTNLFTPLIFIMFIITAFWLLFAVGRYRKYRQGFGSILRAFGMIVLAFICVSSPAILSLPNSIAVGGQAIMIGSMNKSMNGSGEMCSTDVGAAKANLTKNGLGDDPTDTESNTSTLAQASKNMQSVIGCTFWEAFLFKPWVQGQFGTDYNKLWADKKIPSWADKESATTIDGDPTKEKGDTKQTSSNIKMVGDAGVPVGGGKFINNWGLYQLSTQTNAHSPTGKKGESSKYTSGVANDWWRIVDALGNYTEKEVKIDSPVTVEEEDSGGSEEDDTPEVADGERVWPTSSRELSGNYGGHSGVDIRVPVGSPIYASLDGTVEKTNPEGGACGGTIMAKFSDGSRVMTCHGSKIDVKPGDKFKAGDKIGETGGQPGQPGAGRSTGPHLHFEISKDGQSFGRPHEENRTYTLEWLKGSVSGSGGETPSGGTSTTDSYMGPDTDATVMNEWDVWTGNSIWGRVGTALSALVIAPLGMLAPFILALFTTAYAVGLALLMAFAPVMFLLGAGPPRTYDIFKAWLELVINTMLKRIVAGVLLTLSIILSLIALDKMGTVGWWQGMLMLILSSMLVLKSRGKITEMVASIRFAAHNFAPGVNQLTRGITRAASGSGKALMAGAAGGVASRRSGGSFIKGAGSGAKSHVRNAAYTSTAGRHAMASFENEKINRGEANYSSEICASCGREIKDTQQHIVSRDSAGNYYCQMCHEDGYSPDDAVETTVSQEKVVEKRRNKKKRNTDDVDQTQSKEPTKSRMDSKEFQKNVDDIKSEDIEIDSKHQGFDKVLKTISYDVENAKEASRSDSGRVVVSIPNELKPYLDEGAIGEAWRTGNYDYIQTAYSVAASTWFQDTTGESINRTLDEVISDVGKYTEYLENKRLGDEDSERPVDRGNGD